MKAITYKGFKIETTNGSSYIYLDGELLGCTHSDHRLDNSADKAKKRIDNNTINLVNP
jgi:hypothetical protein